MPPRPREWRIVGCNRMCSLNETNLHGGNALILHGWYEEGIVDREIHERATAMNMGVSFSAIQRHRRNHLVPADQMVDVTDGVRPVAGSGLPKKKIGDLELLDAMIAKGAETIHLPTVKISAEQMLRAMELRYKLTQGSALEDFFGALGQHMDKAVEANPDAEASEEEQAQGDAGA